MDDPILIAAYLFLFLWLIRVVPFFKNSGISSRNLSIIFFLKVLAGTALWAIYTYHYPERSTADIFKYFDDGAIMFQAIFKDPFNFLRMLSGISDHTPEIVDQYYMSMDHWFRRWETGFYNDSHTIIRWNAAVMIFSHGNFHVHTVFMSFFSLIGCTALYRALVLSAQDAPKALLFACFLLPSVLLWSSAPTKEGLLVTGLGLFLYAFFRIVLNGIRVKWILLLVVSALLVLFQKFYVLAAMGPALLVALWQWRSVKPPWQLKVLVTLLICGLLVLVLEQLGPGFELLGQLAKKQEDFINHAHSTGSESIIPLMHVDGSAWGYLRSFPHAFLTTLFGPGVYWKGGSLGALANLENLFLLSSLITSLVFRRRLKRDLFPPVLLSVGFILVFFTLIGWTTPVLGALVRYRTPALPFLLFLSLILVDRDRLLDKFPFARKFLI